MADPRAQISLELTLSIEAFALLTSTSPTSSSLLSEAMHGYDGWFMKMPNGDHAIVEIRKLLEYCLNSQHPRGRNKARVFASVGIREVDAEIKTFIGSSSTSIVALLSCVFLLFTSPECVFGPNPLPKQQGRAFARRPWKDRADFAAGTSIGTSHWVLSVVLLSKLRPSC